MRADAGLRLGHGHVGRLRALAEVQSRRGATVTLAGEGIPTGDEVWRALPLEPIVAEAASQPADAELPATAQRADVDRLLERLEDPSPELVILDSYRFGWPWQERMRFRSPATRIVVIDDLPGRQHEADLLIDPNLGSDGPAVGTTPGARLLRGTAYVPLAAEYRAPNTNLAANLGRPRIVVSLGGGRSTLVAGLARALARDPRLAETALTFIVPDLKDHAAVSGAVSGRSHVEVLGRLGTLRDSLESATLAIGAGGTSAWERLRLGVPSVVVALADNQLRACRELSAFGLAEPVDRDDEPESVVEASVRALADVGLTERVRTFGPLLVDALGAERLALAMRTPIHAPKLRSVEDSDVAALFSMANDPDARVASRASAPIEPAEHLAWFAALPSRTDTELWIADRDGLPVGVVRFSRRRVAWEVSFNLEAAARGHGWSIGLIRDGIRRLRARHPDPVVGVVRVENAASHRVFQRLGFESDPEGVVARDLGVTVERGFSAYLLPTDRPTP
jgi:spore coat polysaccharide biosynthesis predicted glycosyltransferase SpsG/RimJ/RimL family protein N-acetyltransferase